MKWFTDESGQRRIWYDDAEIEALVDKEVLNAGMSGSIVDLEAFTEIFLGVQLDQHADLPADVLGFTEFGSDGDICIYMNRDLTSNFDSQWASLSDIGRWRATLAHEIAHVLLHRVLYEEKATQLNLLATDVEPSMKCYKKSLQQAYARADWREIQANKGMAALLMPRTMFVRAFDQHSKRGLSGRICIERLARDFNVSRQAADLRVATLRLDAAAGLEM